MSKKTSMILRMPPELQQRIRFEFDRHCVKSGQWDARGKRKSLNKFLIFLIEDGLKNQRAN